MLFFCLCVAPPSCGGCQQSLLLVCVVCMMALMCVRACPSGTGLSSQGCQHATRPPAALAPTCYVRGSEIVRDRRGARARVLSTWRSEDKGGCDGAKRGSDQSTKAGCGSAPHARARRRRRETACVNVARDAARHGGGDRRVAGRLGVDLGQFAFVTHNAARGDELVRCARQLSPEAVRPQSDLGVIWGSLSVGQRFGWRLSLRRSRDMVGATGEHIGWHDKCVWSSGGGGGGEHPAG